MEKAIKLEGKLIDLMCYHILCQWEGKYQGAALPDDEPQEHTLERVKRTLYDVCTGLEHMLPRELRTTEAYLRLEKKDKVSAEWCGALDHASKYPNTRVGDLEDEFTDSACVCADLSEDQSIALGKTIVEYLLGSPLGAPPIYTHSKTEGDTTWLRWHEPVMLSWLDE